MSINDNFGNNRAKFRKVYAYGSNRRPDIRTFVDAITETTKSVNFQGIIRDRDCFLINGFSVRPDLPPVSQYLEMSWSVPEGEDYINVVFPWLFDGVPFVGFTVYPENTTSGSNVAFWASNIDTTGFRANFSAPFSGSLLFRAVYNTGDYPLYVERTSGSGDFAWVSAGTSSYTEQSSATMAFAELPNLPESVLSNPTGATSTAELAVAQVYSEVKAFQISTEFSSPFTGVMQLVAISTVPTGTPQPVDPQ